MLMDDGFAGMAEVLLATLISALVGGEELRLFPPNHRLKPFHVSDLKGDQKLRLVKV